MRNKDIVCVCVCVCVCYFGSECGEDKLCYSGLACRHALNDVIRK